MRSRRSKVEGRRSKGWSLWLLMICFALSAVAQEEESLKLQPPLGEIPPAFWEQYGLTVILGAGVLVLFIVLGIWFWLRLRSAVVVTPEVQARRDLEALCKCPEDGVTISRASQILRQYVL